MDNFLESLPKMPEVAEMRLWDKKAVDFGIPETILMENAARGLLETACALWGQLAGKEVWLFMGGGNNGGDAAAMARQLADLGARPVIFATRDRADLKGSPAWHLELALANGAIFQKLPCAFASFASFRDFCFAQASGLPCLIVDALLGTGFQGELKAGLLDLIKNLNSFSDFFQIPVLAVDIPSGLNADTGKPSPSAVKATATCALAAPKPGVFLRPAPDFTGKIICKPIGLPQAVRASCPATWRLLSGSCLIGQQKPISGSFKNSYGHVLILGGAEGYAGAAHVAARAALRAGAGLVTACAPEQCLSAIKSGWPEIMTLAAGSGKTWPTELPERLLAMLEKISAIVIGPGLGRTAEAAAFLRQVLQKPGRPPAIIDADALVLLADMPGLPVRQEDIMTPHPGEAGALLQLSAKAIQTNRPRALARLCANYQAVIVLKGAGTLIGQKDGLRLLCPYDIPQLAIGGAGDALAGCLGALRGSQTNAANSSLDLAAYGTLLHAMAGLACARQYPRRGLAASELADRLSQAVQFAQKEPLPLEGLLPWPV